MLAATNYLYGAPVITNREMFERNVRVEQRVRGGYMNRWLIREITLVTVVDRSIVHTLGGAVLMHPDTLVALRAHIEARP